VRVVQLWEKVLEGKLEMLGEDHPDSAAVRERLDASKARMSRGS
jgi:hypothetical protein